MAIPLVHRRHAPILPPQIEHAVEQYADEAHSKLITVLPLKRPRAEQKKRIRRSRTARISRRSIIEQITEDVLTDSMRRRIDVVGEHSAIAIANGREHHDLFLMPRVAGHRSSEMGGASPHVAQDAAHRRGRRGRAAGVVHHPCPFQLSGKGTLEPVDRRDCLPRSTAWSTR